MLLAYVENEKQPRGDCVSHVAGLSKLTAKELAKRLESSDGDRTIHHSVVLLAS